MSYKRNYSTISNTLPVEGRNGVRRPEEAGPLQAPQPVPACLFLERFPLDQRHHVLSRFFSRPGIFSNKKFESLRSPKGLVAYVRRGVCSTLAEYRSMNPEDQSQFSDVPGIFEAFRDNLDKYPEEAEAFARLALDNYIYLDVCTNVDMEEESPQRSTPTRKPQMSEATLAVTGFTFTNSSPFARLTATVRVQSPLTGESEYMCSVTLNQRRRTSPLGITWDMGGIPVYYRRAVQHLVSDLADQVLAEKLKTSAATNANGEGGRHDETRNG